MHGFLGDPASVGHTVGQWGQLPSSTAASLKHLLASCGVASPAKAEMQTRAARFHCGPRRVHVGSSFEAACTLLIKRQWLAVVFTGTMGVNQSRDIREN